MRRGRPPDFRLPRSADRAAEPSSVRTPPTSGSPRVPELPRRWMPTSRDNTPSTSADEHTQHCLEILADANESIQAHIAFFAHHTEDILFSPNAISFIRQQREHFIEQLQISVAQIDALILHQQALSRIFNNTPIDPNTGLPNAHTGPVTTAFRVNKDTTRRDPPVRSAVAPPPQRSRFPFYAVRRGYTSGVFQSWEAAHIQVEGFPNNAHRGFHNLDDA